MTSDDAYPAEREPGVARPGRRGARRAFFAALLRKPGQIGAVAPSSPSLAGVLASVVPTAGAPVVVELGPGDGRGEHRDRRAAAAGARHLAVELDPRMAGFLRQAHPGLEVVEGDAAKLAALLAERGVEHADAVVCGLPWALFDDADPGSVLEPGGRRDRAGPARSPRSPTATAWRWRRRAGSAARCTPRSPRCSSPATVWRNMPPAFVYVCRHPRMT